MLYKRLKELRKGKKITQQELADILNTNRSNIANYEQDVSEPNIETLIKMASYFDVTIDYLIGISPYKTFNEQAEYEHSDLSKSKFFNLNPIAQNNILKTINKLIDLIAEIEKEDYHLDYFRFGLFDDFLPDYIAYLDGFLDQMMVFLIEITKYNNEIHQCLNDKSITPEERRTIIDIRYMIQNANDMNRQITDFVRWNLEIISDCFVKFYYTYGIDNKLIKGDVYGQKR